MPADLREAHERNDEVLERIYIGRRFRNDTERLEKLFELYTKMTSDKSRRSLARQARLMRSSQSFSCMRGGAGHPRRFAAVRTTWMAGNG